MADYEEINLNFSNPDESNKSISEALQNNWIVKTNGTSYQLTTHGVECIKHMNKNLKIKLLRDLKTIVTMTCPTCSAKLSGLFYVNTKQTQIMCRTCKWKSW